MNAPRRAPRRFISGVILLDKPIGLTSNAALQKVRWLFNAEKAGHTGALDPLATGLLPLCLGEATKFSHFLLDADKCYQAVVQLGTATDTGDREGEVIEAISVPAQLETVLEPVLAQFRGPIQQVPPMYSALKRDGRPLYELARQGIEVARDAREVTIHALSGTVQGTQLTLNVLCSKGTYIRTLGEDIAKALGTCGHLAALRRTQTGSFQLAQTVTIEQLEAMTPEQRDQTLLPVDALISDLPRFDLDREELYFFQQGQAIAVGQLPEQLLWRIYGPDMDKQPRFAGLAERDRLGRLQPKRLIVWTKQ